ncbi:hypothetical protein [Streptomyces sp. SPB162]|uniref:hypothetical protein n=1 Tax=Streptomyces sp. SPB162 TaxID=2940560 RepID=UPI002405CE35|nr:hypothetical protein [Streptomyces sp. SPB162]
MLAEGCGHAQDVGSLDPHPGDQVLQGHAELHVCQGHGAQEGGAGSACHVGDAQWEAGQREVLRVVQGGEQHTRAAEAADGVLVQICQRQPGSGVREVEVPVQPSRPDPRLVRLSGQVRDDPLPVGALQERQASFQCAGDVDPPSVAGHEG